MAINRLLDERFDAANPRTKGRHLPAGQLSRRGVWIFTLACTIVFAIGCLAFSPQSDTDCCLDSSFAILGWLLASKAIHPHGTLLAGIALMLAPICAWLALRGEYVLKDPSDLAPALWLGGVVLFWVGGFDIIYACQDYEVDRNLGLHSIPAKLGIRNALRVAKAIMPSCGSWRVGMTVFVPSLSQGFVFWIALGIIAVFTCLATQRRF